MKELIGKVVVKIELADGEQYLRFTTTSGQFTYLTEGDCCSETWFADLIGVYNLLPSRTRLGMDGHRVTSVIGLDLPEPKDARSRQEYDSAYGYAIETYQGTCTVVYRNSSNGCYGGSCALSMTDLPDGLVWKNITEDFSA
jgi:hypothetical protein